jgi:hypothetical protein
MKKITRKELEEACREARQKVGKMTRKEKDELFKRGMRIIYGEKFDKNA